MPPPSRPVFGSALEWLARAESDLALARAPLPDGAVPEDLAYHMQQAAEKAIKAVYVQAGHPFRYTHDLRELVDTLLAHGITVPEEVEACTPLSDYAFEHRYPGLAEPVTEEELQDAIYIAGQVVSWAASQIEPALDDEPTPPDQYEAP